jgi:hypothetical protein
MSKLEEAIQYIDHMRIQIQSFVNEAAIEAASRIRAKAGILEATPTKFKIAPKATPKLSIKSKRWSEADLDLLIAWKKGYVRSDQKSIEWITNRLGRSEDAIEHKVRDLKKEGRL